MIVRRTVCQKVSGGSLRHRDVHRRQHALARRRVDGIADDADDLVARLRIESQTDALPDRLLAREIPAHERFVHDGNRTAAHAVAGLEVAAAAQRNAHRLEPAWCRGVQPERRPARPRDIGPSPTATMPLDQPPPGEQPYRGDRRGAHAWHCRRRVAQAFDARTARLGRPAARLEVQLHDEQWLWHEAERQLVERRKRTQEQSRRDDQDERHSNLGDDERTAHGKAAVARHPAARVLERLARR